MREGEEKQVALFIDFENVAISAETAFERLDTAKLIETAEKYGRVVSRRAYGDWTRFSKYSQDLLEHAIEAIQMFHYGGHNTKNAADIQMVVDILEMMFSHPEIDVFVLATGDSDFSAIARKLRSYSKYVIGIGLQRATSEVLVKACDQFLLYDTLVESGTRTQSYSLEQARALLMDTMKELARATPNTPIFAGKLKVEMQKKDSTFTQEQLGFSQFRDFLTAQSDMVELTVTDGLYYVSLTPSILELAFSGPTSEYRKALEMEGLSLLDPTVRTEVLRDLFSLLRKNPAKHTLESAEVHLKSKYDAENLLRSRKQVRDALRLARFSDAYTPTPESWELDPLTIRPGLGEYDFVDRCESLYIAAFLKRNLSIDQALVSRLLFGTADKQVRVAHLVNLAKSQAGARKGASSKVHWQIPPRFSRSPHMKRVLKELENCQVEGEISMERALQASEEGRKIRPSNFELAKNHFLKASRIVYLLLQKGAPGASPVELEWQLSNYCAAAAGAAYSGRQFPVSVEYYLAFFSIAVETEPVWEKVKNVVPAMTSYYFSNAANLQSVNLDVVPSQTQPFVMINLVLNHDNPEVVRCGRDLATRLASVNPAVLRKIIQRLEAIVAQQEISESNGENEIKQEEKTKEMLQEILKSTAQVG
jgi:uncharacterized protein (TIGR00288 family)